MAGSLSVRKKNAERARQRRIEAFKADRARANEAATANTGKLGSGIASIPGRVVNYIKSSSPSSFGRDVKGLAKATVDAATEDPNAFIEDAIAAPFAAIRDFGDVRETARKLRAQGRDAEAEAMEAMAGTAILSAVPILGKPAGVATRRAIKAATPPELKVTPKAKAAPELTVTPKGKKASTPQIAALKDVRPSTDDVFQVMDANTTAGKVTGDKMMPIDKLVGGVTGAADDARRVDQLVEQMSSPEGYVSRLIVDDAGNVIEGQHRLEALRRLGATKVPVTQYADLERGIPFADVRDAAAAQGIHPDQANQITKQLAEIYADEGGNMAEVMNYGAPKGFEAAWNAAVGAMPSNPLAVKAFVDINPELYGLRKTKDLPRLQASPVKKERFSVAPTPDKISLGDYEGRPFIISMADRTAAGDRVTGIGDVDLNLPVDLQGGQDFMFKPTADDLVWASEPAPVSNIMNLARQLYNETGEKPILMPYRMGGEGSDFATFTGETMMSYADAALGKSDKTDMNRLIEKYISGFAGISNPEGYRQFADLSGDKRKRLQLDISNTFGEAGGGLTLPMTRAVVADPAQLNKPSFFLQNVGEIDPTADVVTSTGHRTYSRGVPGRGLGVLGEDINVAQLLPNLSKIYQIGDPRAFRGQNADFTDYGRGLKIDEEAAMREKALRQGKIPKIYNTERGGTSKYMMSGAKFGVLTPELLRLLAGE
jgi:hypothetical protein